MRSWYRRTLTELSHLPHIRRVAIQTNLSCRTSWLDAADPGTLALWCTFHPGQTPYDRFLAKCHDLARRGIRHLLIEKRRPQTNGKVERYQQTLKREWALGQVYRSSEHRAAALSHWLEHYNTRRPHSALGGLPPISRVHNVPRQDI